MDLPALRDSDGKWTPARIELEESSGPVAPRYQFRTLIVLATDGGAPRLRYDDEGAYKDGLPSRRMAIDVELPGERWERLWAGLVAQEALARGGDLIGDERRKRVGISFNHVAIKLGAVEARFDYLLSLLDDDAPEHAPHRAIIALLKQLARDAAATL
jgi:hypothetical protein